MKSRKTAARLGILFIGAVVVPAGILAMLAVRAIDREEAYVEKQLQQTLSAELVHVASLIGAELDKIREELDRGAPSPAGGDPGSILEAWKNGGPLVRTPFLLNPDFEILWPRLTTAASPDQVEFLKSNQEFIANKAETPVYANIALAYQEEIAGMVQPPSDEELKKTEVSTRRADKESSSRETDLGKPAPGPVSEVGDRWKMDAAKLKEAEAKGQVGSTVITSQMERHKAIKDFEANPEVQQRVYQQAKERGQQSEKRNVAPSASVLPQKQIPPRQESIYISELKRFNDIIAGTSSGIIPRFRGDKLTFLFWKKAGDGRIVGGLIDQTAFRNRLLGLLPDLYSPVRILTILDENGRPLAVPDESGERDWRRPFVSQEISEILPRWEAAAYLTDPGAIASRANLTALILWILVVMLVLSILTGGLFVLKTVRYEIDLAKKKTTFVTNVSHELKTPLTSIRMFAEMLRQGRPPDAGKRAQYLDLMVSETERLTRLINNVLDFSRGGKDAKTYAMKAVDLSRLAEEIVKDQRPRLEHNGFAVVFRPAASPLIVKADEDALKQSVLNLLSNAEKYSDRVKEIDIEIAGAGGQAILRVKDRGIGVPPSQADKIFEEFYRADDSLTARTRGTGLGLSIARRIVRDHGGEVGYRPREGCGSVFEIILPQGGSS